MYRFEMDRFEHAAWRLADVPQVTSPPPHEVEEIT
jgi:hypothetical protein